MWNVVSYGAPIEDNIPVLTPHAKAVPLFQGEYIYLVAFE